MRKSESKEINGVTYVVTLLGGATGKDILVRVVKAIAPVFSGDKSIAQMVENIPAADLDACCKEFSKVTRLQIPDEKAPRGMREPLLEHVFDDHFSGEYDAMYEWLQFCFELNYTSFFQMAVTKLAEKGAARSTKKVA